MEEGVGFGAWILVMKSRHYLLYPPINGFMIEYGHHVLYPNSYESHIYYMWSSVSLVGENSVMMTRYVKFFFYAYLNRF